MSEDARMIRSVNWKAIFPFLHLFRAFRLAIHPSKLLLAFFLVTVVYSSGRMLDRVWPDSSCYPRQHYSIAELPDEVGVSVGMERSGPFDVLLKWELTQLSQVTYGVLDGQPAVVIARLYGLVVQGPVWGFQHNPVFSLILAGIALVAWSLFGGAIARIAAVQVARDAQISVRSALRFSSGKLLSFFFAPVILGIFIGVLALAISVVNLLFCIPFAGPIVVGAGFIFTLAAGLVLTFALFCTIGGSGLMYPTIAVEGSDSFDSISRSFSYFFARPWKTAFYSAVSLVYGVLTFLFSKLFIWTTLVLTRTFQLWWLGPVKREAFEKFFPSPGFDSLSSTINVGAIGADAGLKFGAGLFSVWFFVLVALLGAFVISFYFCSTTITYFLLRQDVDATEMDDVYLQDDEEEELPEPLAGDTATLGAVSDRGVGLPGDNAGSGGLAAVAGRAVNSGERPPGQQVTAVPGAVNEAVGTVSVAASDEPADDAPASGEQPATFSAGPPV